ncbi:GNAT family N-acetyltransferase [Treponema primitia]|uniref:GNAT family N-acetyltransferase n=1 Tax=Treponema primitia TaxID=88058 RepID=UPI0002554E4E|nr:GNAT family N-acetyltransferase [Treponema primitia]
MNLYEQIDYIFSLEDFTDTKIKDQAILDEYVKFRYDGHIKIDPWLDHDEFRIDALQYLIDINANYFGYAFDANKKSAGFLIGRIPGFNNHRQQRNNVKKYITYLESQRNAKDEFIMIQLGGGSGERISDVIRNTIGVSISQCAWLTFFKTMESFQGKGYGKQLITDFMAQAKNYPIIVLTTTDSNFGFYEHMGFARVWDKKIKGKEHHFIYAYTADAKTMKKYRQKEKALKIT